MNSEPSASDTLEQTACACKQRKTAKNVIISCTGALVDPAVEGDRGAAGAGLRSHLFILRGDPNPDDSLNSAALERGSLYPSTRYEKAGLRIAATTSDATCARRACNRQACEV